MENESDEQFIIMQAPIESNKQDMKSGKKYSDEKIIKFPEEFKAILAEITDQINTLKSSPNQKDSTNPPDPTNVVPTNSRAEPLDGVKSMKIGGM